MLTFVFYDDGLTFRIFLASSTTGDSDIMSKELSILHALKVRSIYVPKKNRIIAFLLCYINKIDILSETHFDISLN